MGNNMNISNAEMKVMNHIWEAGEMVTVPDMVTILNEESIVSYRFTRRIF